MRISLFAFSFILFSCGNNAEKKKIVVKPKIDTEISKISPAIITLENKDSGFYQNWAFPSGQLKNDTLHFFVLDTSKEYSELIHFKKNGQMEYGQYIKQPPMLRCGNGLFVLDTTSSWESGTKPGQIILTFNGYYTLDNQFKIKNIYKINSSVSNRLVLIKTKSIYNKWAGVFEKLK